MTTTPGFGVFTLQYLKMFFVAWEIILVDQLPVAEFGFEPNMSHFFTLR